MEHELQTSPLCELNTPNDTEYSVCTHHGRYIRAKLKGASWCCINPSCPACVAEWRQREVLGRSNIPPRFSSAHFGNFVVRTQEERQALDQCIQYASSFHVRREAGQCLILHGGPGTGKTHLAVSICKKIASMSFSSVLITAAELVARIRSTWASSSEMSEEEMISKFSKLDLLIIDEIGRQSGSTNEKNLLFRVVNRRYEQVVPTIILTNCSLVEAREWLGGAVYDRFREGGGLAIEFGWESYRGKK